MENKKHGIEWLNLPGYRGETWNPHGGCSKVSEGCRNCWAIRQARRLQGRPFPFLQYEGTVRDGNWTGRINKGPETHPSFFAPIHWQKPRAVFPCSMSDFFHPGADGWRETLWHTIYDTPQHLYLVLTKRPERIPDCLPSFGKKEWPWPHVWLGASVENNDNRHRVDDLLKVPAAMHFLSAEPLLGPIDLSPWMPTLVFRSPLLRRAANKKPCLDWVIVGGESGPGARPMHPDWARGIRDQCQAAGVPFFFKQQGEWAAGSKIRSDPDFAGGECFDDPRGGTCSAKFLKESARRGVLLKNYHLMDDGLVMGRVGKKRAGRLLDGREWSEVPI